MLRAFCSTVFLVPLETLVNTSINTRAFRGIKKYEETKEKMRKQEEKVNAKAGIGKCGGEDTKSMASPAERKLEWVSELFT